MKGLFIPAYLDPGTGAMVLQWIIAAGVGLILFFRRTIFGGFSRLLRRVKGRQANGQVQDDDDQRASGNTE
ncbi:MAG: hypothetical protein JXR37_12785 [Kiritimatiellae bacterium]|nr:hypothetical protein [Kiritimatiellia bacterium]